MLELIGKYNSTAFFIHSFTCHLPSACSAMRNWPLSNCSITLRMASMVSAFFKYSRFSHAFSIISCIVFMLIIFWLPALNVFILVGKDTLFSDIIIVWPKQFLKHKLFTRLLKIALWNFLEDISTFFLNENSELCD